MSTVKGFTLIEILIALVVFAILATLTSSAMYTTFTNRSRVSAQADQLNALQLAITQLQRDTEQVIERPVRSDNMVVQAAFIGSSSYFEFTRNGIVNPNSQEKRSHLARIAYFCQQNQLVRRQWLSLDTTDRSAHQDKILVEDLSECRFAFLNNALQVLNEWRAGAVQLNQQPEPFPKAIQLNLAWKKNLNMSYLFIIPKALYASV